MASLSAVVTDPHRLNILAQEFGFNMHEVILSLNTVSTAILFLPKKLIVLSGGSIISGYQGCKVIDRGALAYADVTSTSQGFNIKLQAKDVDLSVNMTDRVAARKLRAWLVGE